MDTIRYTLAADLPLRHTADVIVVGGGPGGLGAAVMAARAGAKTLLIERYGHLGGMASSGEINPFMPNHANGVCLDRPVYMEWVHRMHAYLPDDLRQAVEMDTEVSGGPARIISKDLAMLAMEDLCLEAGVELLYHHTLADVIMRGRTINALVLLSKSGYTAAKAAVYVDCSGDADLAARAGCEVEMGGPEGFCQPMTLCFKLSGVDKSQSPKYEEIQARYQAAQARGELSCPRENVLAFNYYDDDVTHYNTTRVIQKNGTDGMALSEAEMIARRQLRELLTWLRREIPGFAGARVHSIAHHIGVRETRRVKGIAYLTREAFTAAAKFPDAIARVRYPIDIHNPLGAGTEFEHLPDGEFYEIPYGCVVPKDVDNLTVGGRPISVDHAMHSSMRVMPPACSVGQAAGMAAAVAAATGTRPADLDGVEIRRRLKAQGAYL